MTRWVAAASVIALLAAASAAQQFDFPTPLYDRWHYPFNFSPGTRPTGSVFSSLGTGVPEFQNFNDRDGVVIVAWDTSTLITAGLGPDAYDIQSVTITLTNESSAAWPVDLTPDEWFTFDVNNDTFINGDGIPRGAPGDADGESDDADPGRPIELFGAGFGPVYTSSDWTESSPYVGGTNTAAAPRDPFPFVFQSGTGVMLHVEDSVEGRWNEAAGVGRFTPTPWAVGVPLGYTPGAQPTPFVVRFDLDLSLSEGRVRRYFQEQLDQGRVFVEVTSLIETVMFGEPGEIPSFFMKEGVGLEPGAAAARLAVVLAEGGPAGDVNGDGCVNLADLAVMLANFGRVGDAGPEDGDLDGDHDVDLADLAILLSDFGSGDCG